MEKMTSKMRIAIRSDSQCGDLLPDSDRWDKETTEKQDVSSHLSHEAYQWCGWLAGWHQQHQMVNLCSSVLILVWVIYISRDLGISPRNRCWQMRDLMFMDGWCKTVVNSAKKTNITISKVCLQVHIYITTTDTNECKP